jgi:hypothetical protein
MATASPSGTGGAVDTRHARLIHQREPGVFLLGIEADLEIALRLLGLENRQRDVGRLAGLRVQIARVLAGEIAVPDDAVLIHDDVMRARLGARQVVFGHDHVRGTALQARQRLEVVFRVSCPTLVNARQPLGSRPHLAFGHRGPLAARPRQQRLRMDRRRTRGIGAHALEDLHELVGVMRGREDALIRVAAGAAEQVVLHLVGARHAHQPFGIGQRVDEILGVIELEVDLRGLAGADARFLRSGERIAGGPYGDVVLAGGEPVGREAEIALLVADHRDRDVRAVLLGADHDAFHVAFLGRRDHAGERGGALRERAGRQAGQQEAAGTYACE